MFCPRTESEKVSERKQQIEKNKPSAKTIVEICEYCFIKKQLWLSEDYITVKVNSNVQSISFQTDYSTATSSNGKDDMEMDEEMDEEMDDESDEDEVMNDIAEESINLEDSEDEGNYLGSDRDYASLEDVDTEYSTADEEQQSRNKVM